jgi:hypothetical protein
MVNLSTIRAPWELYTWPSKHFPPLNPIQTWPIPGFKEYRKTEGAEDSDNLLEKHGSRGDG